MDPTARLVTELLTRAIERGATAIYVEPPGPVVHIWFLIGGVLEIEREIRPLQHAPLVGRLEKMAGMDQAEIAVPQQGWIRTVRPAIELAVSTEPGALGEALVLRRVDAAG